MPTNDPFLHDLYDRIHETPMQRKLRKLAPLPLGAVFIEWPGMSDEEMRGHFRKMKELGYTCFKQIMHTPGTPPEKILHMALDEGIIPYWYGEGGWEDITPELLTTLGLPADMTIDTAMNHPKMIEHQTQVIRRRIDRRAKQSKDSNSESKGRKATREDAQRVPGVVGDIKGHELHPEAVTHFIEWLKGQYADVKALKKAWNTDASGISGLADAWETWDDVREGLYTEIPTREYRHIRDILRFRADTFTRLWVRSAVEKQKLEDPAEPVRAGGEMGLFLPFASRGTDMEGIANEMAEGGSFYPSIHPAWHFEEVDFEVVRPHYMQAQIAVDWAKGIWTAPWESTGGPQYFSGGKSPFVEEAQNKTPGFTVSEATMTQFMLQYLAAGFKGFGLWCWNARSAGWEAGEFALLDRNMEVTPRAVRVGQIGQAARKWRRELWQAHKEPLVGVLVDWENEAVWAAMSVTGRDKYKTEPVRARIGVSRALINANVPWEYVTPANLRAGLGGRYKVIYMPAFIAITTELQAMLLEYVRAGGRLVLDMPGAYYDEYSRLIPTGFGSVFEQTFGAVLREYSYANNVTYRIGELDLEGFTAVLQPTRAKVVASYDSGAPAITEATTGKGTAVIIGAQLSLNCYRPGNGLTENLIVRQALGSYQSPYACREAIAYRLASPKADHYFLINDGLATAATLDTRDYRYKSVIDAVTGEALKMGAPVALEANSGRWLRYEQV